MISFRLAPHHVHPAIEVVEVLIDGVVAATIVPREDPDRVAIISAHMVRAAIDFGSGELPIPMVIISMSPRPYKIEDGRIVPIKPS